MKFEARNEQRGPNDGKCHLGHESEIFRLQPVGGSGGALSVHRGSCLDGEERVCGVVVGCGSFPVITCSFRLNANTLRVPHHTLHRMH